MNENRQVTDFLMTIAFSVFGMLLIFGLGFVFPTVNPYIVVKWIVIVCGAVFVYAVLGYWIRDFVTAMRIGRSKKSKK